MRWGVDALRDGAGRRGHSKWIEDHFFKQQNQNKQTRGGEKFGLREHKKTSEEEEREGHLRQAAGKNWQFSITKYRNFARNW